MTIPSRVLGAGANPLSTIAICGDGKDDVVAAGTTRANATQIVSVFNSVDTVPAGSGVKLPPTEAGSVIYIANSGANTLTVYPYESTTVINQSASASISKDHTSIYFAVTNSMWYSINGTKT
jgi:P2-related tail formation protein